MPRILIVVQDNKIEAVYATEPGIDFILVDYEDHDLSDSAVDTMMFGFGHDVLAADVTWPA